MINYLKKSSYLVLFIFLINSIVQVAKAGNPDSNTIREFHLSFHDLNSNLHARKEDIRPVLSRLTQLLKLYDFDMSEKETEQYCGQTAVQNAFVSFPDFLDSFLRQGITIQLRTHCVISLMYRYESEYKKLSHSQGITSWLATFWQGGKGEATQQAKGLLSVLDAFLDNGKIDTTTATYSIAYRALKRINPAYTAKLQRAGLISKEELNSFDMSMVESLPEQSRREYFTNYFNLETGFNSLSVKEYDRLIYQFIALKDSVFLEVMAKSLGRKLFVEHIEGLLIRFIRDSLDERSADLIEEDVQQALKLVDYPEKILAEAIASTDAEKVNLFLSAYPDEYLLSHQHILLKSLGNSSLRIVLLKKLFIFQGAELFRLAVDLFNQRQIALTALPDFLLLYQPDSQEEAALLWKIMQSSPKIVDSVLEAGLTDTVRTELSDSLKNSFLDFSYEALLKFTEQSKLISTLLSQHDFEEMVCGMNKREVSHSTSTETYSVLYELLKTDSNLQPDWGAIWSCTFDGTGKSHLAHLHFLLQLIHKSHVVLTEDQQHILNSHILTNALDFITLEDSRKTTLTILTVLSVLPHRTEVMAGNQPVLAHNLGSESQLIPDNHEHLVRSFSKMQDSELQDVFINQVLIHYPERVQAELIRAIYQSGNLILMASLLNPDIGFYNFIKTGLNTFLTDYLDNISQDEPEPITSLLLYRCLIPEERNLGKLARDAWANCFAGFTDDDESSESSQTSCSIVKSDCSNYLSSGIPESILWKSIGMEPLPEPSRTRH